MVNTQTLYWAAGFLEGRGSTTLRAGRPAPRLRVGSERRDALDRLVAGFGGHVYAYRGGWRWQLSQTESIGVMMTLYPLMSPSRRTEFRSAIARWRATISPADHNRKKNHCPYGHAYSEAHTYRSAWAPTWRVCRACRRAIRARAVARAFARVD